jgi:hypothetical protein
MQSPMPVRLGDFAGCFSSRAQQLRRKHGGQHFVQRAHIDFLVVGQMPVGDFESVVVRRLIARDLCRSCAKRDQPSFAWSCASRSATISRVIRSFSIYVFPQAKLRRCFPSWSWVISILRARGFSPAPAQGCDGRRKFARY